MIALIDVRKMSWVLIGLAAFAVAILNLQFLWIGVRGVSHRSIDHLGHHDFELYTHLLTAPFLLVCGALLFHDSLRSNYPSVHRWLGRAYLGTILITSPLTLRLALNETEGPMTVIGFSALAIVWFATAAMAWVRARQGKIQEHRSWMIRNYALTLTNVTFRAELHILLWLGFSFQQVYEPLRVLQLIPNLLFAETLLLTGYFEASSWTELWSGLWLSGRAE